MYEIPDLNDTAGIVTVNALYFNVTCGPPKGENFTLSAVSDSPLHIYNNSVMAGNQSFGSEFYEYGAIILPFLFPNHVAHVSLFIFSTQT